MASVDLFQDINHIFINTKFELLKHLSRRRLVYMAILALLLPILFYAVPPMLDVEYAETANGFANSNLEFVRLLIIISSAMFAGDAVSSEFEKKTGLLLFPTPQRKTSIFVGKYIAALLATWFVVTIYYFITTLEIGQIYGFGAINVEFGQSFGLALLYSAAAISLVYFFSTILKRTITSTLLGFFFLMLIMPIVSTVLRVAGTEPWFLVTYSAELMTNILGVSGGVGFGPPGREFGSNFMPELNLGIYVMLAYAIILAVVSIMLAGRKKME